MGGSTSKLKRWITGSQEDGIDNPERAVKKFASATILVYTRRSSLYMDEDGLAAHEFYIETKVGGRRGGRGGRSSMRRVTEGLVPMGEVRRIIPCLSGDLPVILYQDNNTAHAGHY